MGTKFVDRIRAKGFIVRIGASVLRLGLGGKMKEEKGMRVICLYLGWGQEVYSHVFVRIGARSFRRFVNMIGVRCL